jgi:hypothetical protein
MGCDAACLNRNRRRRLSVGAVGPKEHLADVMPGPGNALANQALSSAIGGLRR